MALPKQLYTEAEVSEMGFGSRAKLRNDRWAGRGLPYYKINGAIRYKLSDLKAYLKTRRVEPLKAKKAA